LIREAKIATDPFLEAFGLEVKTEPLLVQGRILPLPKIEYSSEASANPIVIPEDGAWQPTGQKFFHGGTILGCAIISFLRRNDSAGVEDFVLRLLRTCADMGVRVKTERPEMVKNCPGAVEFDRCVREICTTYEENNAVCSLIIVILPEKGPEYAEVKRVSDIGYGVMTQCVLRRTMNDVLMKNKTATLINLALKINMKVGGVNSRIASDKIAKECLVNENTLVLGVDVTHPTRNEPLPSIGAVVGNIDADCTKFYATIRVQKNKQESIVQLEEAFRERLMDYVENTNVKPQRILVYRDGISEGQFYEVMKEELSGIRKACLALDENFRPKITFVVVQKRHHTRFACSDLNDGRGRGKNVPAGTVVDSLITTPEEFDFFLCSHAGIQGTSRPTKYHVLFDSCNYSSDALQLLTFYLCHIYGRCARSVSIPAPVYFADLACTRARFHLAKMISSDFGSETSSTVGDYESTLSERELITATTLHQNLKKTMYFA
uniref:Piwi domain-containing protein n=1 Tax=Soboliphyme baturini TaxID=241478 RepID=A0A183I9W0_9BILA